ncbi:MAG: glycosyl transferase family protein [Parcubacteria group bacterium Greene0416_79]|nr:MAG: glycosyl transferase family protein [Parcubacteria group bacterium Greene0416_79]
MQRKKILYVITKGTWGGAQRYVFDLAVALPKEQFETVVACGGNGLLTEKLLASGIRTVLLPSLKRDIRFGKEWRACMELYRLLRKERPDIVHLNSSKAAGLGAAAFRCFQLNNFLTTKSYTLKAVFTVHGWPFNEPRGKMMRAILWFLSALTALLATDIITLSQGDYTQGTRMLLQGRALHLIRNGIKETHTVPREEARAALAGERRAVLPDMWLGTIAECTRNKGLSYLIRAVAALRAPVTLCIIGDGKERARLEDLAETLGVKDRILFTGFKENAARFLGAFDIFLLPSLKEGLPYTMLEAGSAKLPVVASDIPGIREIISDEKCGMLVPQRNTAALAEKITWLMAHPETRRALAARLAARIKTHFSYSEMVRETTRVYLLP